MWLIRRSLLESGFGPRTLALALTALFLLSACPTVTDDPPPLDPTEEEPECEEDDDCDDRDPCTTATCVEGFCVRSRTGDDPIVLGIIETGGPALDVFLSSTRWLHVAAGESGIESYDLNPLPDEPAELARHRTTAAAAGGVSVIRDHIIALLGSTGIQAFPSGEDEAVSLYRTMGPVRSVRRVDDLIVAALGAKGLEIIDYTDFSSPERFSRADTPGRAERVLRYGNALHVSDGLGGVAFVDFRERDEPELLPERRRPTDGRVMALSIRPPLYILAELGAGVGIVDVDQPDLDRIALVQVGGLASDLSTFSRHTALVAAGEGGLVMLDLLDPSSPRVLHRVTFDAPAHALSRASERVALALGEAGVAVIDLRCTVEEE